MRDLLPDEEENLTNIPPAHYYGDAVRKYFIAGGAVMLLSLPFVVNRIPITLFGAVGFIVAISFIAGITNPRQFWSAALDLTVSLISLCFFAYYAVHVYLRFGAIDFFFWLNEILSLLFFLALYFATKTVRGFVVERHKR